MLQGRYKPILRFRLLHSLVVSLFDVSTRWSCADSGDILMGSRLMDTRAHIAADAVGSVRAEGLEPGSLVTEVLDRWVDGAIETEQLGEAAQSLAAGELVVHLLGQREPVPTRR